MTVEELILNNDFRSMVENYRGMCLWSLPEDFMPKDAGQLRILAENMERYGDLRAYRKAGEIRGWLSQISSPSY